MRTWWDKRRRGADGLNGGRGQDTELLPLAGAFVGDFGESWRLR